MQVNNFIDFRRLFFFIRKKLYENYLKILMFFGASAFFALLFAVIELGLINIIWIPALALIDKEYAFYYFLLLLISGITITGIIFNDMHNEQHSYNYLTMPVSNFEKFLGSFLLTLLTSIIGSFILYFLLSYIVNIILPSLEIEHNPFRREIVVNLYKVFVIHALILFSAAYFRKLSVVKLSLVLLLSAVTLSLAVRIIYWEYFDGIFRIAWKDMYVEFDTTYQFFILKKIWPIFKTGFWFFLPPFLWLLTYLRIKEKQV